MTAGTKMLETKWLVTGASGFFGAYVCRALKARAYATVAQAHSHGESGNFINADLVREGAAADLVAQVKPTVVVNCVALANVDRCEKEPALAQRLNVDLCGELAMACNDASAMLIAISTDQLWRHPPVFVTEDQAPDPVGVYGQSKAHGEMQTRRAHSHMIARTNFFGIGPAWKPSLSDQVLARLRAGQGFNGFNDVYFTPIAVALAAEWLIDMVEAGLSGTFHLAGRDRISKYDFAVAVAKAAGLDTSAIKPGRVADAGLTAARPSEMSLSTKKIEKALGRAVPDLDQSIHSALASAG